MGVRLYICGMKKILLLVFAMANTVVYAQSKKKQIITLNNRVDSFRLALSSERQSKLSNEKRDALKINNLKIEIENKKLNIDSLGKIIVNFVKGVSNTESDFNKLMFDESGDFILDTILNHKNWLTLKLKVHGYDGSDESEKYKINGFPEYRLIRYHSFGEIGGENNYFLLKDASLILYFESKYNLDGYKYPDEYEDIISYNSLTYFGQDRNSKNPKYHKTLKKANAIDNFIDGFIDENELYSRLR